MNRLLLIVNPKAGKAQIRKNIISILNTLSAGGCLPSIYLTQGPKDASRAAEQLAPDFDTIACYGGDGTLNEVISGVLRSGLDRTIGYIPAGSTNDYAYSLKLPADVKKSAEILLSGRKQPSDIGMFNGRPFVYVAAFGAFASTSYTTDQTAKNIFGHAAYFLEGAKNIVDISPSHMRVTVGEETIEDDFIFGMISNSESVGGIHDLLPLTGVQLNDGVFEMLLVRKPETLIDWNDIIACLSARRGDDRLVYYRQVSRARFQSPFETAWTLDGENGGGQTDAEILVRHRALDILVPEEA